MSTLQNASDAVRVDEELQASVRSIVRSMVRHAVMTSPIKRTVSVAELSRVQHVLYKLAVEAEAKRTNSIPEKQGTQSHSHVCTPQSSVTSLACASS